MDNKKRRKMKVGHWGIALYNPKGRGNVGGIFRNARVFGADYVLVCGKRYEHYKDRLDVMNTPCHIPTFQFDTWEQLLEHVPIESALIAIEITENSTSLSNFSHPKNALYIFGPEDGSIPKEVMKKCHNVIRIPTLDCLNLNVSTGILMYDREMKKNI